MLHYVPILDYARRKNIRIVGLHPSDDLITAIEHGGLSSLSSTNATEIPVNGVEVDGNKEHWLRFRDHLLKSSKLFQNGKVADAESCFPKRLEANNEEIRRWYEVQCFREEYMAESGASELHKRKVDLLGKGKSHWMIVLAGRNHIEHRDGIPDRLLRRISMKQNEEQTDNQRHVEHLGVYKQQQEFARSRGVYTIIPQTNRFPVELSTAPKYPSADYFWFVERDVETFPEFRDDRINAAILRSSWRQ